MAVPLIQKEDDENRKTKAEMNRCLPKEGSERDNEREQRDVDTVGDVPSLPHLLLLLLLLLLQGPRWLDPIDHPTRTLVLLSSLSLSLSHSLSSSYFLRLLFALSSFHLISHQRRDRKRERERGGSPPSPAARVAEIRRPAAINGRVRYL